MKKEEFSQLDERTRQKFFMEKDFQFEFGREAGDYERMLIELSVDRVLAGEGYYWINGDYGGVQIKFIPKDRIDYLKEKIFDMEKEVN